MAKQTMFGEGKNRVQETTHVRSSTNFNGGQITRKPVADGPLNTPNTGGVLGSDVTAQNAGRYPDSPVPTGAKMPDLKVMSKAAEVATGSEGLGKLGAGGVLGRG